jgi:hypothetical protein
MLRRILKIIGWIAGGTLGLGVALYLIAIAINWRDREPSAAAVQFTNLYRERPSVADEDNAFIYAMGFAVEPGTNPLKIGLKRVAWSGIAAPQGLMLVRTHSTSDTITKRGGLLLYGSLSMPANLAVPAVRTLLFLATGFSINGWPRKAGCWIATER